MCNMYMRMYSQPHGVSLYDVNIARPLMSRVDDWLRPLDRLGCLYESYEDDAPFGRCKRFRAAKRGGRVVY